VVSSKVQNDSLSAKDLSLFFTKFSNFFSKLKLPGFFLSILSIRWFTKNLFLGFITLFDLVVGGVFFYRLTTFWLNKKENGWLCTLGT
jgi:hypothetical protein